VNAMPFGLHDSQYFGPSPWLSAKKGRAFAQMLSAIVLVEFDSYAGLVI
jgi:hypothetical protein